MAIEEINNLELTAMSEEEKRKAKQDARVFTNRPNEHLNAEQIKKQLGKPTDTIIRESDRLVREINSIILILKNKINEIASTYDSNKATTDTAINNVDAKVDREVGKINTEITTIKSNHSSDIGGVYAKIATDKVSNDNNIATLRSDLTLAINNTKSLLSSDIDTLDGKYSELNDLYTNLSSALTNLNKVVSEYNSNHTTEYNDLNKKVEGILEGSTVDANSFAEIVAMINNLEDVTIVDALAQKVNYNDIVNNLTSVDYNKPLSANMGKVLKDYVENYYYDHFKPIETKVINRDGGVILSVEYQTSAFESITSTTTDGTVKMIITY